MKRRIALLGPPASGKGTLAQMLCSRHSIPATSMGALLRAEREAETPQGIAAAGFMERGELVPDEIVDAMIGAWLQTHLHEFLLDGFPRTLAQAIGLDRFLTARDVPLQVALILELDDATISERMRHRLICAGCRKSVNVGHHVTDERSPCPYCGGRLQHRPDDTEEVLARRLQIYRRLSVPVIRHYESHGIARRIRVDAPSEQLAEEATRLLSDR